MTPRILHSEYDLKAAPRIVKNDYGVFYFMVKSASCFHRLDGPAIIRSIKPPHLFKQEYRIHGVPFTEEEYWQASEVLDYLDYKGTTVEAQKSINSILEI